MKAVAAKLDHPIPVLVVTLALSGLFLFVAQQFEPASFISTFLAFTSGGVLFAIYAPSATRWSRAVDRGDSLSLLIFGLSFPFWGLVLLPLCGGLFGLLHATVCSIAILALTADWRPALAPTPVLASSWLMNNWLQTLSWLPGDMAWLMPILTWNIQMAVVFGVWSDWRRRHPPPDPRRRCPVCRYSLTGLRGAVCPECGATVTPLADSGSLPADDQ